MRDLEYKVVRSPKRKRLTLIVERDRTIVVHAPETATSDAIRRTVDAKRQWLLAKRDHPQKYADQPQPPGKEVVNGESAPYLGRDYRIEIADTISGQVEFSRGFIVPASQRGRRREVLRQWYMARARKEIISRVEHHARELGVTFTAARIVDNRYRWGSCTIRNKVNFNWRLIKAPMFVIDYVIVHELAHLLEGNHSPRFWGIVRAKSPQAEKAKVWLKEHGQILEQEL